MTNLTDVRSSSRPVQKRVIFSFNEHLKAGGGGFTLSEAERLDGIEAAMKCITMDRGGVTRLEGKYLGEREISFQASFLGYLAIRERFSRALNREKTVLRLGHDTGGGQIDARSRLAASLWSPDLKTLVADLGFFGSIAERDALTFDGWTRYGDKYFVCMSGDDWRKYELITANGPGITGIGQDWRDARQLWLTPEQVNRAFGF